MDPKDYETYVARLIEELQLFKGGTLSRNRRYRGIRQPGEYEVDISLEFTLSSILSFLVIVECKNWSRPVDRPAVQKLAQTREAIGAHKGVMVSPSGFTKEAVKVANVLGIDLWVATEPLGLSVFDSVGVFCFMWRSSFPSHSEFRELRSECIGALLWPGRRDDGFYRFSLYSDYLASLRYSESPAVIHLAEEILRAFVSSCPDLPSQLLQWRNRTWIRLLAAGVQEKLIPSALEAVLQNDQEAFHLLAPSLDAFSFLRVESMMRRAIAEEMRWSSHGTAKYPSGSGAASSRGGKVALGKQLGRHLTRRYSGPRGRGS